MSDMLTPDLRASYLTAVRELDRFEFGPARDDVRRLQVFSAGRLVGVVDRLLVETATRKVRYAVVTLDRHAASDDAPNAVGGVLVPIGSLRRVKERGGLELCEFSTQMLVDAPRLHARPVTRGDELATLAAYGCDATSTSSAELYAHERFDERQALAP